MTPLNLQLELNCFFFFNNFGEKLLSEFNFTEIPLEFLSSSFMYFIDELILSSTILTLLLATSLFKVKNLLFNILSLVSLKFMLIFKFW